MSLSSLLSSPRRGAVAHIFWSLVLSFFFTPLSLVFDSFFSCAVPPFSHRCPSYREQQGGVGGVGVCSHLTPHQTNPLFPILRACRRRRRTVRGIKICFSFFPKEHGNPDEARESADADGTGSQCPGRTDAQFHHVPLDIGAFPATPSQHPKSQTLTHTSFLRCSSGQ